jgi:1-acyl-sn-glycerol-3-phosphate acyltransferase
MKLILKKAHSLFYRFSVLFFFLIFWPFFYFFSRKPLRYKTLNNLRGLWAQWSSALSGIFYRIHYEEKLQKGKPYIICPNHTSNLDVSWACLITDNYHFMGKDDLLENPVTRLFFHTIDIPVNRQSKLSSFRAFKKTKENLQAGMSLIIFPEGQIGDDYPPRLHEFKSGPFRLAIELNIPIVPVSSINTWKVMWDDGHQYGSRPGICDIYIHKPIETTDLTLNDEDWLKSEVFETIYKKIQHT